MGDVEPRGGWGARGVAFVISSPEPVRYHPVLLRNPPSSTISTGDKSTCYLVKMLPVGSWPTFQVIRGPGCL